MVGIFADLTGDRDPEAAAPVPVEMKERRIVDIDRDNFNDVMARIQPGLQSGLLEGEIRVRDTDLVKS